MTNSGRLVPGELADAPVEAGTPSVDSTSAGALHIVVINGDGAVNILNRDTALQPVVQVCGRNNEPIAGAVVTFTSPNDGPGDVFLNGSRSVSVTTDSAGRAVVVGMRPAGVGAFKLGVSASSHGQLATATISQVNYATVAAATAAGAPGFNTPMTSASTGASKGGLSNRAKGGIIAGVATAAVLGAVLAMSHGGSSSNPAAAAAVPTASIGVGGPPTTGAPH